MIQRLIYLKLKDAFCQPNDVDAIVAQSSDVFEQTPLVVRYSIGRPSDAHTAREWQLMFTLEFKNQEDVDTWRQHPLRRAFFEQFLKPMRKKVLVCNWSVGGETEP